MRKLMMLLFALLLTAQGAPALAQTPHTQGSACYQTPYLPARGVSAGETATVTAALPVNNTLQVTFSNPDAEVTAGETVTLLEGPFCWMTRNANLRQWHVRVNSTGFEGYAPEYIAGSGVVDTYLTAASDQPAQINHFVISSNDPFNGTVPAGGSVTLSWDVSGQNTIISLYDLNTYRQLADDLSATGTLDYTFTQDAEGRARFLLSVKQGNRYIHQAAAITVVAFAGQPAPTQPTQTPQPTSPQTVSVEASYQAFENGAMLWRGDTRQIYVFVVGRAYQVFDDTWQGETFDIGQPIPAGRVHPQFGIGKIWATQPGMVGALGWATAGEIPYTATIENGNRISLPYGGGAVILYGNSWQFE